MKWRYLGLAVGMMVGMVAGVVPVRANEDMPFEGSLVDEEGEADDEDANEGLMIYAVGGGYSEDGVRNNWDFVELSDGEAGLELDGYVVRYVRANSDKISEIGLEGLMLGEALLLRYRNSPQKDGDFFYSFDIAVSGGRIELWYFDEMVDSVAWGKLGEDERYGREGYFPFFEEGWHGWEEVEEELLVEEVAAQCADLRFSEVYSYFENEYGEQFLEIYNPTDEIIPLEGCVVRYKNKDYAMSGEMAPGEYLAYRAEGLKLTKNPSGVNSVELLDVTSEVVAVVEWGNGQKKGTSMVYLGMDESGVEVWARSYAVTPGAENVLQEYRICVEGKVINPATGNCIGVLEDEGPLPCPEGKFRNPETNRCKSLATIDNILAPCPEGKYRNPETNRCKSLATLVGATLTPCAEGYERNPETNRCRKVRVNGGTDYGVEMMSYEDKSAFLAYGALAAVGVCGVVYIVWQFRREIGKPFRLMFAKIRV